MLHIAWHHAYILPLPEDHRFPMLKYELIPEQLLYEGTIHADNLFAPEPCPDHVVCWTHTPEYLHRLKLQMLTTREQRQIGFSQSPELIRRELIIAQGTIDCCGYAAANGVALNVAGGTHHAFADRGEGFCLLNDFGIAANYLLHQQLAQRILIVDLDVHQGNGTASLFAGHPAVFTFSMHGKNNYPFKKEHSTRDIELPDRTGDEEYLALLAEALPGIIDQWHPDFMFYLSGVDVLATDRFGKLGLSLEGCLARDEFVLRTAQRHGIPCVVAMGGGYSPDIRTIVDAHANTFRAARSIFGL